MEADFRRKMENAGGLSRKELLQRVIGGSVMFLSDPSSPALAVTEIPEFKDYESRMKSVVLNTYNPSVHESTVNFFTRAFTGFKVVKDEKSATDNGRVTVVAYGDVEDSVGKAFVPGVSNYNLYGGHCSITLSCPSKATSMNPIPDPPPPTNLAYIQLSVPGYRISQVYATGGTMISAYGYMNALAPNGVQVRAIVGDNPGNEISYVAVRAQKGADCKKVAEEWTRDVKGLKEWSKPPQCRPGGQEEFEPRTFPGAVYLGVGEEGGLEGGPGVLILPSWYKADGDDEYFIDKIKTTKEKVIEVFKGEEEGVKEAFLERKVIVEAGLKEVIFIDQEEEKSEGEKGKKRTGVGSDSVRDRKSVV